MFDKKEISMRIVSNTLLAITVVFSTAVMAEENVGQNQSASNSNTRVAAGCAPSTSQTDLDINNIRTTIMAGGDMWWDLNNAKYEIPKIVINTLCLLEHFGSLVFLMEGNSK